jgi:PAS domain S-box-containing protein
MVVIYWIGRGFVERTQRLAVRTQVICALGHLMQWFFGVADTFYFSEKHFVIQNQLNKSEKKFRIVFENVQDVFYQTDLTGKVIEVSPSIIKLSEYDINEILGSPLYHLCIKVDHGTDWLDEVLKNGELRSHESTIITKSGKLKYVSVDSRVILDEAGQPNHIDGLIRDVSASKQHELGIEIQNNKLKTQNTELEQFAYIASHDLQEPLLTLTSVSKLFSEEFSGQLNEQGNQYLGFISNLTHRMQLLVKGLLDYSRIGKEGVPKLVDVQHLVTEVLAEMAFSVEESHAKITVETLPELKAYMPELKQVFQSLLNNAIKFRQQTMPLEIRVSAKKQDNNWIFSVSDNGIGIEESDKEKIFVIFKRLHNRNEYEGTGIGLSHCHKIIALHGGAIGVDSKPGHGSTFHFSIPQI